MITKVYKELHLTMRPQDAAQVKGFFYGELDSNLKLVLLLLPLPNKLASVASVIFHNIFFCNLEVNVGINHYLNFCTLWF